MSAEHYTGDFEILLKGKAFVRANELPYRNFWKVLGVSTS